MLTRTSCSILWALLEGGVEIITRAPGVRQALLPVQVASTLALMVDFFGKFETSCWV